MNYCDIDELLGHTIIEIDEVEYGWYDKNDALIFTREDGKRVVMTHDQDCCESVTLEDIDGDLNDLIGSPLIEAEEFSNHGECKYGDTFTYTYYKLGTQKGSVSLRWYGTSNGYYSESVDIYLED